MSQGVQQIDDEFAFPAKAEDWAESFAASTAQPSESIMPEAFLSQFTMPVSFDANSPLQYMPSTQPPSSWGNFEPVASLYYNNDPPGQYLQPANQDSGAAYNHIQSSGFEQFDSGNATTQVPCTRGLHLGQQPHLELTQLPIGISDRSYLSHASNGTLSAPEGLSRPRSRPAGRFSSRIHPYDRRPSSSYNQALSGRSLDNIGTNPAESVLSTQTGFESLYRTSGFSELAQGAATRNQMLTRRSYDSWTPENQRLGMPNSRQGHYESNHVSLSTHSSQMNSGPAHLLHSQKAGYPLDHRPAQQYQFDDMQNAETHLGGGDDNASLRTNEPSLYVPLANNIGGQDATEFSFGPPAFTRYDYIQTQSTPYRNSISATSTSLSEPIPPSDVLGITQPTLPKGAVLLDKRADAYLFPPEPISGSLTFPRMYTVGVPTGKITIQVQLGHKSGISGEAEKFVNKVMKAHKKNRTLDHDITAAVENLVRCLGDEDYKMLLGDKFHREMHRVINQLLQPFYQDEPLANLVRTLRQQTMVLELLLTIKRKYHLDEKTKLTSYEWSPWT